ncbi:MAG: class I SAM-dependent methyltransferase [bacterium]|nr:class I SAM-dependent methyltransferase [bacterium]
MAKKQTPQTPWYSEKAGFFGPGYLKEYGDNLTRERTLTEIDFLEKTLALKKGAKVLDCPCGHGRHSVELARRGYEVTGQDLNGFFIEEARKAAKRTKVQVRWRKGDMRELPFEDEFDLALNLFTAFGYLESDEEDQKALDAVAKSLKHGGKFVLDVINRDRVVRTYREKDWQQLSDGSMIITEKQFDHATGRNVEKRVRIWKNGKREEFSLFVRMYTVTELTAMFRKAGLTLKEMYGSYSGDPLTFDSKRYILIAEKN